MFGKQGISRLNYALQEFSPNAISHQAAQHFEERISTGITSVKPLCPLAASKRWQFMYNPSDHVGKSKFPLITPHIQPNLTCHEKNLYIVVVVNSDGNALNHRDLRKAIRQTWGDSNKDNKWRLFFALGMTQDNDKNKYNEHDALQHNDVIIGKFNDTYRNIPIKTFMSHWWAYNTFSSQYILKTDDDVYVRVPRLVQWLSDKGSPFRFYGGYINQAPYVFRNPGSKWYISYEQYKEKMWPTFCHGAFQVLSVDLLPAYFYYTQVHYPFHTDDAYMGVLARNFGVKVTQLPGFTTKTKPETNCEYLAATAFGHDIGPAYMVSIHETYKKLANDNTIKC